ncbi:MAG: DUF2480 family protein [Longimonas sp.]|uniref:DUF2480 family protein n=1 Tax=Longimonas sp. TaxID=2039626 RepID=UPI003362C7C7
MDELTGNITNRVSESEIAVYNLADLWDEAPIAELDIEPFLVQGLMLKEEPFREDVKAYDFTQHEGQHVAIHCSTDAIVPTWGYMLLASKLEGIARTVAFGTEDDLVRDYYIRALEAEDWSPYADRPVVIKGCGGDTVPDVAYLIATQKLQGVARKLMYGEPCSSVPLWRRSQPKKKSAGAAKAVSANLPTPGK